jgi:hypothetical protein
MSYDRWTQEERAAVLGGVPPAEGSDWEAIEDSGDAVEMHAIAIMPVLRYQRVRRIVEPDCCAIVTQYRRHLMHDPGERVIVLGSPAHDITCGLGENGFEVQQALCYYGQEHGGEQFRLIRGMPSKHSPLPDGQWSRLPECGSRAKVYGDVLQDRALYALLGDPSFPFSAAEIEAAFGHHDVVIRMLRFGAKARIEEYYENLDARARGELLQRVAKAKVLADFTTVDLKNPMLERIFRDSLHAAISAADVEQLKALERAIIAEAE